MNAGMARAFRKMIKKTETEMGVELQRKEQIVQSQDKLRARLAAWERGVNHARVQRGGEEGEIWNLEA